MASEDTTGTFIKAVLEITNGVIAWMESPNDLVETSCNLGIVRMERESVFLSSMIRSFYRPMLLDVVSEMRLLAEDLGLEIAPEGESPAWAPAENSELVQRFMKAYESAFSKKPVIQSIHAGLECGHFSRKFPDMDMIACGPTITGAHTTEETLYLPSTKLVVELLLTVLSQMNESV